MSDTTKQNAEAVEALAPETRQVTAGGKTYTVRRLETRQVWPTLRAGLPIIEGLVALIGPTASSPAAGSPLGSSSRSAGPGVPRVFGSPAGTGPGCGPANTACMPWRNASSWRAG